MTDHADELPLYPAEQTAPGYRAPVLVDLGTFHDLTEGATGSESDGSEAIS